MSLQKPCHFYIYGEQHKILHSNISKFQMEFLKQDMSILQLLTSDPLHSDKQKSEWFARFETWSTRTEGSSNSRTIHLSTWTS